jgi:hypothetical protein
MNLDELLPAGGLDALATQLGIPRERAQQGAAALLPSLLGAMGQRTTASTDGAGGLDQHVATLGGASLADNVTGSDPTDIAKGNELLGGILGSKDASRQVATQAAQTSGLDPALLKQMLPILAMLVTGYMARRSGGQAGGLGGILGSVLGSLGGGVNGGGRTDQLPGGLGDIAGGGLGGILNSVLGGGKR